MHELGLDDAVYAPRSSPIGRGLDGDRGDVAAARDEAAAHRTPFGVVTLTTGMQVHPEPAARLEFMQRLGIDTLSYPDERLAAFGRQAGIPVLALAPALQGAAEREKVFMHGFPNTAQNEGRWNARGHAAAAGMAGWVCERLVTAGASRGAGGALPKRLVE